MSYLEKLLKRLGEQSQSLALLEYDLEQRDVTISNLEDDLLEIEEEIGELKQRHQSDSVTFIVGSLALLGFMSYTLIR